MKIEILSKYQYFINTKKNIIKLLFDKLVFTLQ